MKVILLDPDGELDYFVEWARWLAPFGDTIDTSAWIITPDTLTKVLEIATATRATIWLKDILPGAVHTVTNHIETVQGRKDDRSFKLVGRER